MKSNELTKAIRAIEEKGYTVCSYDNYEMGKLNEEYPVAYEIIDAEGYTVYGYGTCHDDQIIYFAQVMLDLYRKNADDERAAKIARLEKVIKKAEQQKKMPTKAEKDAYIRAYNNLHNEGGEGFSPWIVSEEEYQAALQELKAMQG